MFTKITSAYFSPSLEFNHLYSFKYIVVIVIVIVFACDWLFICFEPR